MSHWKKMLFAVVMLVPAVAYAEHRASACPCGEACPCGASCDCGK